MAAGDFGRLLKELRARSGQTLRSFCLRHQFDPGNISRLERGHMPPPESDEKVAAYAQALGLKPDTADWHKFIDVAAAERGRLPKDLLEDKELVAKLPVLFRTLRGKKADGDALDAIVEKIRKA